MTSPRQYIIQRLDRLDRLDQRVKYIDNSETRITSHPALLSDSNAIAERDTCNLRNIDLGPPEI